MWQAAQRVALGAGSLAAFVTAMGTTSADAARANAMAADRDNTMSQDTRNARWDAAVSEWKNLAALWAKELGVAIPNYNGPAVAQVEQNEVFVEQLKGSVTARYSLFLNLQPLVDRLKD